MKPVVAKQQVGKMIVGKIIDQQSSQPGHHFALHDFA
jgi:hypothetical protein